MSINETKYFTVNEAEKTLPLVKQIVKDILAKGYQLRTISESMGGEIKGNPEVQQYLDEINDYIEELNEIGCHFKDWNFSIGLVDFPAIIDGDEVFLCWRSDEDKIEFYHKVEEGYAGRKRIPKEYF